MTRYLASLFAISLLSVSGYAQRLCGANIIKAALAAKDPSWQEQIVKQKASLQGVAEQYRQQQRTGAHKPTTAYTIPVIFHFLVTESQLAQIGGVAGVAQRVDAQITVLNRDYNRGNLDSALIPANWKPLWGNAGIHFGLAHTNPGGFSTPGFEIKVIPDIPGGFSGASGCYANAKHNSAGGTDSWDVTKYINIWCTNFTDFTGLLGLCVARSQTGGSGFPLNEMGLCINYAAIGKRAAPTDFYIPTGYMSDFYDQGRTLTHELGHFFELGHTWGDDAGACPWTGGQDDGLADTPPEADHKYYAYPYDIPGGTYIDSCHNDTTANLQPIGVACLSFMNYTDDIAMQLFTPDQAAVMAAQVATGGENYSLTQNPALLDWGLPSSVSEPEIVPGLIISPNPTTGTFSVIFDTQGVELQQLHIYDVTGRMVYDACAMRGKGLYTIDLYGMNRGIYFVRCTFATGTVTRKIMLQ